MYRKITLSNILKFKNFYKYFFFGAQLWYTFQDVKRSIGTVQLVRDKVHPGQVIPDVYLDEVTGVQKLTSAVNF